MIVPLAQLGIPFQKERLLLFGMPKHLGFLLQMVQDYLSTFWGVPDMTW